MVQQNICRFVENSDIVFALYISLISSIEVFYILVLFITLDTTVENKDKLYACLTPTVITKYL